MPPHTTAAASSAALPHAATLAADSTAANVSAHAAILVSASVALLGFVFGLVVLRYRSLLPHISSRTRTTIALRAGVSGLLIGIGLLVMLPHAAEELVEDGWRLDHVMLLFLSSVAFMFVLEHCVLQHAHVHHSPAAEPAAETTAAPDAAAAAAVNHDNCAKHDTFLPGSIKGRRRAPPPKEARGCIECDADDEESAAASAAAAATAAADSAGQRILRACGLALSLFAWVLHAVMDGMLLGAVTRRALLVPLAVAVAVCALMDVPALVIYLSQRGVARRGTLATLAAFNLGFPAGTAVALGVFAGGRSRQLLNALRCVVGALFIYIALFEMAPPHTHSRALNTLAVAAFAAGVAAAYSAELLEDWAAGEPAHGGDADHAAWHLASHMLDAGTAPKPARALAPEPFLRW